MTNRINCLACVVENHFRICTQDADCIERIAPASRLDTKWTKPHIFREDGILKVTLRGDIVLMATTVKELRQLWRGGVTAP